MKIIQRLLIVSAMLAFLSSLAAAQGVTVIQRKACPKQSGDDPSIVTTTSVLPKRTCGNHDWQSLERIHDTRLGIVFNPNRVTISLNARFVEPAATDIAESRDSCMLMASDKESFEEWVVGKGASCDDLGDRIGWHRWFGNGRVCLIGSYGCVLVSDLTPTGQKRVEAVYERIARSEKNLVSGR